MVKTNVVHNKVRRTVQATSKVKLPDEILVSILSLLTMTETARTAVLSRRWRNLWTYAPSLNFDFVDTVFNCVKSPLGARDEFVDWVNQVLKVHQGSRLDKFRVTFDVDDKSFKCDVDNWINYALVMRVKRLALNFSCYWPRFVRGNYTRKYSLVSLIELRLNSVDVTGEVLDYFLSTCPFLEVLSVQIVASLVNLRVSGVPLVLKYLEISHCQRLENIEISATNLTSLKYFGPKVSMHLEDVPHLVDASLGGSFACSIINNIYHLSSYLSQLERLTLNLGVEIFENFPKFPKLRNLKHLVLLLNASVGLLHCPSLLNATPSLH